MNLRWLDKSRVARWIEWRTFWTPCHSFITYEHTSGDFKVNASMLEGTAHLKHCKWTHVCKIPWDLHMYIQFSSYVVFGENIKLIDGIWSQWTPSRFLYFVRSSYPAYLLTNYGRMTQICFIKLTITGSDIGLSSNRRQAIIWTNV